MKQVFAILLLTVILSQTFSRFIIIANYELNKEYISKVLCENRDKPKMNCNGKCQLNKQLEKENEKEQSPANPLKEKNETQIYFGNKSFFSFLVTSVEINKVVSEENNLSGKHLLSVFHPPQV